VEVRLDMDPDTPGDQVPDDGLFSGGVGVTFDASMASAVGVSLPDALDNSSSEKTTEAGYAGAAGAVDFFLATNGYAGATFLAVTFTNLAPGSYTLTPGLYYAAPMENFVGYASGAVLDGQITNLVTATVRVGAEPKFVAATHPVGGTLTFTCELPSDALPPSIDMESADPTGAPLTWAPVAATSVTPVGGGRFEVELPLGSALSRWYRFSTQ
jgi:hypothetical protein